MAQKNIDFGTFPDDPNADAIRTAFQKVQENFSDLYAGLQEQAVLSVNRTAGPGVYLYNNSPTGNVVLGANIAYLRVTTSTLAIGRDGNGSPSISRDANITQSSQTLYVDLPANIEGVTGAAFSGTVVANVFNANSTINTLNLSATANIAAGNISTTGSLSVTGNANAGNINTVTGVFSNGIQATVNVVAGNLHANSGAVTAATGAITGNLTAGNILGVFANGTSNVRIPATNGNVNISAAGNANVVVVTGTGANITGTTNVTGNLSAGNVDGGNVVSANFFVGNGSLLSNVVAAANTLIIYGTSNAELVSSGGNFAVTIGGTPNVLVVSSTGANVTGTLNVTGNANVGNIGATNANVSDITATGNINAGNLVGTLANGTSSIKIPTASGNINLSVNGNANVLVTTGTGVNVAGTLNATGNANVGNLAATRLIATGNVTSPQLISNVATGTSPLIVSSTTKVANLNADLLDGYTTDSSAIANTVVVRDVNGSFSANVVTANLSGNATTAGTVTTNAQPNITSVGTLSSLTVTGNTVSGNVYANSGTVGASLLTGTLTTAAQPNITSVGTLTGLNVNGNITAANITANTGIFTGNGSGLTNLTGANVTGTVANATYAISAGSAGSATTAGTVTTNAQPNITSVGTLTSLGVNGTVTAVSFTANTGIFTGNGSGLTNLTGANVTGTVANATYAVSAGTAGTVTTNAQPNITSVGTLSSLSVTANVTAGNVYANSGTIGANLLTGTLTTAAQPNITSVGTLSSLTVVGNANAGNISTTGVLTATGNLTSGNANLGNLAKANYFQGDGSLLTNISVSAGSFIINGTSNVTVDTNGNVRTSVAGTPNVFVASSTGVNVAGALNATGNANVGNLGATGVVATTLGGALTTASQPNVTSLGTLTGLTVNGVSNLGSNGNVIITGGVANSFLMTNGSGNLTWNTATLVPAQGSNTQVIFNDGAGVYAGNANLTFNKTTGNLSVGGGITANGNVTAGNINGANLVTANFIAGTLTTGVQPNITTVGTLAALTVTGTTAANNFNAQNYANAKYIIANSGPITSNIHSMTVLQTWNNALVRFSALEANIIDTASAANSLLLDLQISNASRFAVSKEGNVFFSGTITGNGSGLSAIAGANVTGAVANATYATSAGTATSATTAATVTTNAQPNITSVGTLTSLTVTGNISAGNIAGGNAVNSNHFIGRHVYLTDTTTVFDPAANINQTWNNALVNFTAVRANVTDTLSNANSLLIDLLVADSSRFSVNKSGNVVFSGVITGNAAGLSNIQGSSVVGTVANANFALNSGSATTATTANTVTNNAQPNITSVGTLSSLTSSGNIQGANVTATSYHLRSVATGIIALGINQGTSTVLNKEFNVVSTALLGNGVMLPNAVAGMAITIINTSANALLVYPHVGGDINGAAINAAYTQPAGATLQYVTPNTTDWYTVGATFA